MLCVCAYFTFLGGGTLTLRSERISTDDLANATVLFIKRRLAARGLLNNLHTVPTSTKCVSKTFARDTLNVVPAMRRCARPSLKLFAIVTRMPVLIPFFLRFGQVVDSVREKVLRGMCRIVEVKNAVPLVP